MRLTLAFTLAFVVAGPAHAEIEADFADANRIFAQVSPLAVTDDIADEWLPLSTLANLNGAEPDPGLISSFIERICGNDPVRGATFTPLDDSSFEMTSATARGDLTYRFDWIGGAQFYRSFDPAALFSALGLDTMDAERGQEMRARSLDGTSSLVTVYRLTPDLLAMATAQRVEIYGRCPEGDL